MTSRECKSDCQTLREDNENLKKAMDAFLDLIEELDAFTWRDAVSFTELDVRTIPNGKYLLISPLQWKGVTIPEGFVTDFASVPRGFRWLITGHDETRKPAVLHDYLYSRAAGERLDADRSFRQAMQDTDTPVWKRELAYRAVRIGGWITWNRYRREGR